MLSDPSLEAVSLRPQRHELDREAILELQDLFQCLLSCLLRLFQLCFSEVVNLTLLLVAADLFRE